MSRPLLNGSGHADSFGRLLAAARNGCKESLGLLLEQCRVYLLLVASQEIGADLRAKVGASDLVQDTFLKVMRGIDQFAGQTEADLMAWLRRILRNDLANLIRHYRTTGKREIGREIPLGGDSTGDDLGNVLAADTDTPSAQAIAREEGASLAQALERLPGHYRDVIVLRHQEQLSFAEIGQRTGRSAEAARKLWARAVEELHAILEHPDGTS